MAAIVRLQRWIGRSCIGVMEGLAGGRRLLNRHR